MREDIYTSFYNENKTRSGYDILKNNIKILSVYFRDETQINKVPYIEKSNDSLNITSNILLKYSLKQEDKGLDDAIILTCLLLNKKETKNIYFRFPDYFNNKYISKDNDDYFDTVKPNKQKFLEFLDLQNKTEGMVIVPVTVKDHYSTLFIDLQDKKMLCLFDSGLSHTDGENIEEQREILDQLYTKLEETEEIEEIEKIKNEIKSNKIHYITNPYALEYVFGENLAKDIICLNDYCLQDEQSCGYWTIAACELGASKEYGILDKIQKDCESGIFQIKLAKRVLEITDDIIKEKEQNIILINPSPDSFNEQDYTKYKKENYIIFIKNIDPTTIIGVDLQLLQQQMASKDFILQQKTDVAQQQTMLYHLSESETEFSNLTTNSLQ